MIDEVIAMGLKHDETIKFDSRGFNHQQYADISDKWCLISSWTLRIVLPYPVCWGLLQYGSEKQGISDIPPPGSQENLRNGDAEREGD